MEDLEGMINGILNNPEEMKKIMDMAGKIMGTEGASPSAQQDNGVSPGTASAESILSGMNLGSLGGLGNLGNLGNLGGLASAAQSLLGNSTIKKLLSGQAVQNMLGEAMRPNNDKKELFNALKPWLSEKRRAKLEKAIVFARVMRIVGASGIIKGVRE